MMRNSFNIRVVVVLSFVSLFFGSCIGRSTVKPAKSENDTKEVKTDAPTQYSYTVKMVYPHSTTSYTQGLFWHEGSLWESVGEYGASAMMEVELKSGKTLRRVDLGREHFGEGAAILNGKIYQLTWMEGVVFVYDAATLKESGKFRYSGEGWGLTTDGSKLYMSDGSHEIHVINPVDFKREATISVQIGQRHIGHINEMEWIEGRIWANVYESDSVVIIDPVTGQVEGIVDFSGLLSPSDRTPDTDVLNGIAYDPATGRIFVTGKNWNKLFEVVATATPVPSGTPN